MKIDERVADITHHLWTKWVQGNDAPLQDPYVAEQIRAAIAEEREACAGVADEMTFTYTGEKMRDGSIAKAIRAGAVKHDG